MKQILLSLLALLGVSTMAKAQTTIEVTLLEDQSLNEEKVTWVILSSDGTFWNLFETQDPSLLLTVVVDNSACNPAGGTNEIGWANVGFGGNYNGEISETPTIVWLSAEGAGTVNETSTETYAFRVEDIIALFSAEATQDWDLGATIWDDQNNSSVSAWGGSYGEEPEVTTVEPYLDGSFNLENLYSLQVQVNNSSVLVSVSYSYEDTSTAISNVNVVEAVEVARYNLAGQKLSGAEKGINIVVYSDGSAKKVLVK